jgi:hypothetical protein
MVKQNIVVAGIRGKEEGCAPHNGQGSERREGTRDQI